MSQVNKTYWIKMKPFGGSQLQFEITKEEYNRYTYEGMDKVVVKTRIATLIVQRENIFFSLIVEGIK